MEGMIVYMHWQDMYMYMYIIYTMTLSTRVENAWPAVDTISECGYL